MYIHYFLILLRFLICDVSICNFLKYSFEFCNTLFFIHKNSLKFSLVKRDKCQCAFLERFGHVEIKQILLVGEIAS